MCVYIYICNIHKTSEDVIKCANTRGSSYSAHVAKTPFKCGSATGSNTLEVWQNTWQSVAVTSQTKHQQDLELCASMWQHPRVPEHLCYRKSC